ncbi:MAG: hypothetical protein JKY55_17230 [Aliivibrio sp.]|uniref:hypothetical protein n=1 Tax=Aliivibrio sp. TaxID=1872443 RepID=UPI001A44FAF0|nr:hypothetical protein [Aliivibrio sp.]
MSIIKILMASLFVLALLFVATGFYHGSNASMDSDKGSESMAYFGVAMLLLVIDAGVFAIAAIIWLINYFS